MYYIWACDGNWKRIGLKYQHWIQFASPNLVMPTIKITYDKISY